jgi:hypothetical protein
MIYTSTLQHFIAFLSLFLYCICAAKASLKLAGTLSAASTAAAEQHPFQLVCLQWFDLLPCTTTIIILVY